MEFCQPELEIERPTFFFLSLEGKLEAHISPVAKAGLVAPLPRKPTANNLWPQSQLLVSGLLKKYAYPDGNSYGAAKEYAVCSSAS